jgi:hypothetical protein
VTLELKFLRGKKGPKTCATSPLPSTGGCEWGTPIPVLVPYSQLRIFGASVPSYRLDWIVVSYSRVATGAFRDTVLGLRVGHHSFLLADWCLTRSYGASHRHLATFSLWSG